MVGGRFKTDRSKFTCFVSSTYLDMPQTFYPSWSIVSIFLNAFQYNCRSKPFQTLYIPWNTTSLLQENFFNIPRHNDEWVHLSCKSRYSYLWEIDITLWFALLTTQCFLSVWITWWEEEFESRHGGSMWGAILVYVLAINQVIQYFPTISLSLWNFVCSKQERMFFRITVNFFICFLNETLSIGVSHIWILFLGIISWEEASFFNRGGVRFSVGGDSFLDGR